LNAKILDYSANACTKWNLEVYTQNPIPWLRCNACRPKPGMTKPRIRSASRPFPLRTVADMLHSMSNHDPSLVPQTTFTLCTPWPHQPQLLISNHQRSEMVEFLISFSGERHDPPVHPKCMLANVTEYALAIGRGRLSGGLLLLLWLLLLLLLMLRCSLRI